MIEGLKADSKVTKEEAGPVIDQLYELLNHPRSPLKSALETLPFAEPHKLPAEFVKENFHKDNPELDIDRLIEDGNKLKSL